MADRMIPVPESLIERNMAAARGQDWVRKWNVANELHALLSQPEPSAVHFAPYGSSAAVDGTPLPQATRWDVAIGEYQDGEPFTVKRDRTTCPNCRARFTDAAPPSITDMVPGTAFTCEGAGGPGVSHRFRVTGEITRLGVPYLFCSIHRTGALATYVDPSTIRDVTPPPTTPGAADG